MAGIARIEDLTSLYQLFRINNRTLKYLDIGDSTILLRHHLQKLSKRYPTTEMISYLLEISVS